LSLARPRGYPCYACNLHVAVLDVHPKESIGQDHNFAGRIHPLHIVAGIGFRYSQILGLAEGMSIGNALIRHPGENVVAGAVEDAPDAANGVSHQGSLHQAYQGHCATHCGLELEHHAVVLGHLVQLVEGYHQGAFVGGHNMLAS
jgi:hypothetical protein